MPEFLAETYAPQHRRAQRRRHRAGRRPGQPTGGPAQFLVAVAVPEEETRVYLYQARSASAVRAAMTCVRLRPERITPSCRPGRRRPHPAP